MFVAYAITVVWFILSRNPTMTAEVTADYLSFYYQVLAGINGIAFLLLTVTLLNYGSRLEKLISALKLLRQSGDKTE